MPVKRANFFLYSILLNQDSLVFTPN
jgi:hypothetical protein